jgi:hypothetical protein
MPRTRGAGLYRLFFPTYLYKAFYFAFGKRKERYNTMSKTARNGNPAQITETQNSTLAALETMTAGELEAKEQSANDKPRKAPIKANSKTKGTKTKGSRGNPPSHAKSKTTGTKGKGSKGSRGNSTPAAMSAETMEEITLQYFRNVANVTFSDTFQKLQQSITDPHIMETGTDHSRKELEEIIDILDMPEEKKMTFTAGHLQNLFKYQADHGRSSGIEETIHFYQMFFPDDSRSLFRLAITAGYILDSGRLKEHLRA